MLQATGTYPQTTSPSDSSEAPIQWPDMPVFQGEGQLPQSSPTAPTARMEPDSSANNPPVGTAPNQMDGPATPLCRWITPEQVTYGNNGRCVATDLIHLAEELPEPDTFIAK
eukprot:jgi/Chrzof1/4487/Cz14g15050.t1